jgi:peptidoglycan hydrolase-like protein with peptidoglycan-binding domain
MTQEAVKAFQVKNGIAATGTVGSLTRAALNL